MSSKAISRRQEMKDKMRAKRGRRRGVSGQGASLTLAEQEALKTVEAGSDQEASILESAKMRQASNESRTDDAILTVLDKLEEDELREENIKIINNLLNTGEMTDEEKRAALAKVFEDAEAAKKKFSNMKDYNQAVLAAKLAARKKMKEDLAKEKAMKDEVSALAKKQVQ